MDTRLPYWGSVIFSILALILLVVNVSLANANHAAQTETQQRQATISGGQAFSQLNQSLVQAMADASIKNNDTQMRDLLAAQGITIKENAPSATSTAKPSDKK